MKHANAVSPNISSNPFLVDIKETVRANGTFLTRQIMDALGMVTALTPS